MVMNKARNGNSTQAMNGDNMHPLCSQECATKIFPNSTTICLISLAQKCGLVHMIDRLVGLKGSTSKLPYWYLGA